jgi:hypothetical protein
MRINGRKLPESLFDVFLYAAPARVEVEEALVWNKIPSRLISNLIALMVV